MILDLLDGFGLLQTVSLSGFNSLDETYTPEKQTVVVSNIGGNEQLTFRLGLYGVFTGTCSYCVSVQNITSLQINEHSQARMMQDK